MIVKRFKGDPERGFDEWATLAFLTEQAFEPPGAPRFLGGDAAARIFVMEDLGPGWTLEDLLRDGDAAAAAEALVALTRLTCSLHALCWTPRETSNAGVRRWPRARPRPWRRPRASCPRPERTVGHDQSLCRLAGLSLK